MMIPDHCRTDHLYLLIGGNPLPNYVAACLLLKTPNSQIRLIHTSKVASVAKALRELLASHHALTRVIQIEVPEAGEEEIVRQIRRDLEAIPARESVGLYYTGGTKAMVAHTYYLVREEGKARGRPVVFSYLDASTMSLHLEPVPGERPAPISLALWPLENAPTVAQLAALHAERVIRAPSTTLVAPHLAAEMTRFLSNPKVAEQWRKWCGADLKPRTRRQATVVNGELQETVAWPDLTNKHLHLLGPLCARLAQYFDQDFDQEGRANFNLTAAAARLFEDVQDAHTLPEKRTNAFVAWLDGGWLEEYVLDAVAKVADRAQLHEFGRGLETNLSNGHNFELDMVAMRGYRLFTMSCTTSTEASAGKSKLFEAMIRATQLGGSEARVALIALYSNPSKLQNEVAAQWGVDDQVKVFGPGHLASLPGLLERWFSTGE